MESVQAVSTQPKISALIMMREDYGPLPELQSGHYYVGGAGCVHILCGHTENVSIMSCNPGRPSEELESCYSAFFDIYGQEYERSDYVARKGIE